MPSVTIDLSPEQTAALQTVAEAQGLTLEQWLLRMLEQQNITRSGTAALQKSDPEEWARRFHEWAEGHDRNTPLLPEESISRDKIYPDLH
jgi:hypothetical protein